MQLSRITAAVIAACAFNALPAFAQPGQLGQGAIAECLSQKQQARVNFGSFTQLPDYGPLPDYTCYQQLVYMDPSNGTGVQAGRKITLATAGEYGVLMAKRDGFLKAVWPLVGKNYEDFTRVYTLEHADTSDASPRTYRKWTMPNGLDAFAAPVLARNKARISQAYADLMTGEGSLSILGGGRDVDRDNLVCSKVTADEIRDVTSPEQRAMAQAAYDKACARRVARADQADAKAEADDQAALAWHLPTAADMEQLPSTKWGTDDQIRAVVENPNVTKIRLGAKDAPLVGAVIGDPTSYWTAEDLQLLHAYVQNGLIAIDYIPTSLYGADVAAAAKWVATKQPMAVYNGWMGAGVTHYADVKVNVPAETLDAAKAAVERNNQAIKDAGIVAVPVLVSIKGDVLKGAKHGGVQAKLFKDNGAAWKGAPVRTPKTTASLTSAGLIPTPSKPVEKVEPTVDLESATGEKWKGYEQKKAGFSLW